MSTSKAIIEEALRLSKAGDAEGATRLLVSAFESLESRVSRLESDSQGTFRTAP